MKKQININNGYENVISEIIPSVYVYYKYEWKCNRCGKKLPDIDQCDNCGSYDIEEINKI
jgi:rRNA maturation endonuclease Nob1